MEASKNTEMLRFSVLNMTSLSAQARETLFAILQKAAHDLGHGKVALDYQDLVDIGYKF